MKASQIKKFINFKLILALWVILLSCILYFDFWVYKKFVLNIDSGFGEENITEEVFLLKTPLLEKSAEEIRKKDAFLQNPQYPLIKDPF
ncbi:MAG: hypothetical protein AAB522_01570 [Patescibacteria group bacterium]